MTHNAAGAAAVVSTAALFIALGVLAFGWALAGLTGAG